MRCASDSQPSVVASCTFDNQDECVVKDRGSGRRCWKSLQDECAHRTTRNRCHCHPRVRNCGLEQVRETPTALLRLTLSVEAKHSRNLRVVRVSRRIYCLLIVELVTHVLPTENARRVGAIFRPAKKLILRKLGPA